MSKRRRIFRGVLIVALAILAVEQTWRHGYDYVLPEKFLTVDEGRTYRGAWQMTWPMRRIVRDHDIKTVVALAHPPESPWVAEERAMGEEMGFRFVHIPIGGSGARKGDPLLYDQLQAAADVIGDPANQPVYFHCHHGVNRVSMAQMAYRMLHCGYTLEEAAAEIDEMIGLKTVDNGPDYRAMAGFYRDRVLPLRQAEAGAGTGGEKGPASEAPDVLR